mgnify:CR=1 FL=1
MTQQTKRIAVNFGGGYVPGLNAVIAGTVLASRELGWEVFGIQDGYDGLLFPDRYPGGGLVPLTPGDLQDLVGSDGCILGTAPAAIPFAFARSSTPRSRSSIGPMKSLHDSHRKGSTGSSPSSAPGR